MAEPTIEDLRADVERLDKEVHVVWGDRSKDPTDAEWRRIDHLRPLPHDHPKRTRFKGHEAWGEMVRDCVEVRYFVAQRRLLLAEMGLNDAPDLCTVNVKDQPERMGVLIIVVFHDRLAAIDYSRWFDARFAPESAEIYRAMVDPANATAKWLGKREAEGNPWVPKTEENPMKRSGEPNASFEEWWRLVKLIYPTKELREARRQRRPFTREEVHATLNAVAARSAGEPPRVEDELRSMELDGMTPVQALITLQRLQAQARNANECLLAYKEGGLRVPTVTAAP